MADAMMMIDPGFTVVDAMVVCGVDHDILFLEETQATRLAGDIFLNQFSSCMDITFKELDERFKAYSDLTIVQGQIRVRPGPAKTSNLSSSGLATRCVSVATL